jgi:hypothetical protein
MEPQPNWINSIVLVVLQFRSSGVISLIPTCISDDEFPVTDFKLRVRVGVANDWYLQMVVLDELPKHNSLDSQCLLSNFTQL